MSEKSWLIWFSKNTRSQLLFADPKLNKHQIRTMVREHYGAFEFHITERKGPGAFLIASAKHTLEDSPHLAEWFHAQQFRGTGYDAWKE